MEIIDIITVSSITLLAVCLFMLLFFLVPILVDLQKILLIVHKILSEIHGDIMPNVKDVCSVIGKTSQTAQKGQDLSRRFLESMKNTSKALSIGINSYISSNKKK